MRNLKPDEIEVRVGTVGAKGVTMLLYKNARVDRQILDETFGQMNWQTKYSENRVSANSHPFSHPCQLGRSHRRGRKRQTHLYI